MKHLLIVVTVIFLVFPISAHNEDTLGEALFDGTLAVGQSVTFSDHYGDERDLVLYAYEDGVCDMRVDGNEEDIGYKTLKHFGELVVEILESGQQSCSIIVYFREELHDVDDVENVYTVEEGDIEELEKYLEIVEEPYEDLYIPTCKEGCMIDGNCVPYGARLDGKYCGLDGHMHYQKEEGVVVEEEYECASQSAQDGECEPRLEQQTVFQRVLGWFSKILYYI
jgi:hypothetical protein